jgi:hypothetical protein
MRGWQYLTIDLADVAVGNHEVDKLNAAGTQGWELMRIASNNMAYMKRPLEEPEQATDTSHFARVTRRRAPKTDAGGTDVLTARRKRPTHLVE